MKVAHVHRRADTRPRKEVFNLLARVQPPPPSVDECAATLETALSEASWLVSATSAGWKVPRLPPCAEVELFVLMLNRY